MIIIDNRVGGKTETDVRGQFLTPDITTLVTTAPQAGGTVRKIYAHTRTRATYLRGWLRENPTMIDGMAQEDIAMIVDDVA